MMVVSDTGPINYLILIGQIGLLPSCFDRVVIPATSLLGETAKSVAEASARRTRLRLLSSLPHVPTNDK